MPPHSRSQGEPFRLPHNLHKGPTPPIEVLPWFWNPDRCDAQGTEKPPAAFAARLAEIDPDLRVVWAPLHKRWILWVKNPRLNQNELCQGWQLLFIWERQPSEVGKRGEALPLSELLFHNIFLIAAEHFPNAKTYFDRIQADIARQKAAREKDYQNTLEAEQAALMEGHTISTAAPGNRFALHHDGTMAPSAGHQAHMAATVGSRIPSEMLKRHEDDREKRRYGR